MVTITKLTPSSNHLCLVICLSAMMTKYKVCKAVWSHRAMLHLAVPDKARNSTTLSPPSVHRPVSQHPSLWTTPQICLSSLLLFWEVLPLHKKNIPTILQKSVKCLHLRIKKVLSLQNKVIWTKTFKLCNTYHLLLSSLVHNSHKASLTLQTWSALHLCTSPPPSCHMFQRPNPHPSVLQIFMPSWMNALETGSRVQLLNEQRRGVFSSDPGVIRVYLCQSLTHWLRTLLEIERTDPCW